MFFKNSKYKHYRKLQKKLNVVLLKELNKEDFFKGAKKLGMLKKDGIILEENGDLDLLQDFIFYDLYDKNGCNAYRRYLEKNINQLSEDEKKVLNACLNSRSSLFAIKDADRKNSTLELVDILDDTEDIKIIDIGMSSTPIIKSFMIYTRILSIDSINMTSGAIMLFKNNIFSELEQEYKKNQGNKNYWCF